MKRTLALLALAVGLVGSPPAHAAAPWSSPARVPGSSGAGYPYDVAVEPDGTGAVAFIGDGIRVAIRSPRGTWGRTRKISDGRNPVMAPDVAVDAAGEVLVAWTQSSVPRNAPPVGRNAIRVAIRSPGGHWSAPRTVGTTELFIDGQPRLATNARGDAVLGWRGVGGTGATNVLLRAASRPARGTFGRARSLGEAGVDLQLLLDDRGVAYAAWTYLSPPSYLESSVRLATRTPAGSWSPAVTVDAVKAGGPQLALTADRRLVIAWRAAQQGLGATRTGLATVTERTTDGRLQPPQLLGQTPTPGPQIAIGPTGETLVVWNNTSALEIGAGPATLSWTARLPDGTFGPADSRPGVGPGPVAMFGDGTAVTMWGTTTLRAVVRPPGGRFGEAELVARRGRFPVLAAGKHIAVAVWLADGRLMAARRRN